jgi:hypothetical protein
MSRHRADKTQLELVVNVSTVKAPGITIPSSLLLRADEVTQRSCRE